MNKNLMKMKTFLRNNRKLLLGGTALSLILWNSESFAGALETQITGLTDLAKGPIFKAALIIGTVVGGASAIMKGSVPLFLSIIGISVLLSYFLGWVLSDGFVQGI